MFRREYNKTTGAIHGLCPCDTDKLAYRPDKIKEVLCLEYDRKIRCTNEYCDAVIGCNYQSEIVVCWACGEEIYPYNEPDVEYTAYELSRSEIYNYYKELKNDYMPIKMKYGIEIEGARLISLSDVGKDENEPYYIEMRKLQTRKYLSRYINHGKYAVWHKGLLPYEKSKFIMQNDWIYDNIVADEINKLSYPEFLETLYWKAISAYKRYETDYKCELCKTGNKKLDVHHKNYKRHGYEHCEGVYHNDLIVLCENCHKKSHQEKQYEYKRKNNCLEVDKLCQTEL